MDAEGKIFKIEIPKEEEIEIRGGQRRTVAKKVFPGYVLVQMLMDDESWNVVRNTPGITGFVGSGNKPTPLSEGEVSAILKRAEGSPQVKVGFRKGESVRVVDGPFSDFVGVVDEINVATGKVKGLLTLFGRETSVELDFLQVQRL
jgi:transcriptional antiterminator NusG